MQTESSRFKNILTVLFFVSNIYSFGGGVMAGVICYRALHLIGAAEFIAFHQSYEGRVELFFVPVFFSSVVISILMIWFGHPAISRKLILAMAGINVFIFAVTAALCIPIHNQLELGKSIELIDKLVLYDNYLRNIPGLVGVLLNAAMLYQVLSSPQTDGA